MSPFEPPNSETSPYRNEREALHERKERLEGELARLRAQTKVLADLEAQESELARELEEVEGLLRSRRAEQTKRSLPLLDRVSVASPCKADWNEMVGDDRVRFCLHCEKNVYDLSSMRREDAEELVRSHLGGGVCVRFYQREDGTVLTQDCPVGVKKKRRKKFAMAAAGASMLAAAAATFASRRVALQGAPVVMGEISAPHGGASGVTTLPEETPPLPPPSDARDDHERETVKEARDLPSTTDPSSADPSLPSPPTKPHAPRTPSKPQKTMGIATLR